MQLQSFRSIDAWLLVATGLYWCSVAGDGSAFRFLLCGAVGAVGGAMGIAALLLAGDRRIPAYAALAFALGTVLGVLAIIPLGFGSGLLLTGSALVGFTCAGRLSLAWEPAVDGIPEAQESVGLAAKVGLDEMLLGTFHLRTSLPAGDGLERVVAETLDLRARHEAHGFLENPLAYHRSPLPLDAPHVESASLFGFRYEHLRFDSEWEPAIDEPGRERWLEYNANRTAHAYVVRGDPEQPWLIAINGYRMGMALTDLGVFDPRFYHRRLGLNLLIPVLPLHGPRKIGLASGDGFLDADPVGFCFAEAQAMWDIRRLVGWARVQGGSPIGVMGLSLGGYNAALLAAIEPDLACVIAGIPLCDYSRIFARHLDARRLVDYASAGLDTETVRQTLRPVCPLEFPCRVDPDARAIFAGVADRVVSGDHPRDLIAHWGSPQHVWYQGAHITFRLDPAVQKLTADVLRTHLTPAD